MEIESKMFEFEVNSLDFLTFVKMEEFSSIEFVRQLMYRNVEDEKRKYSKENLRFFSSPDRQRYFRYFDMKKTLLLTID